MQIRRSLNMNRELALVAVIASLAWIELLTASPVRVEYKTQSDWNAGMIGEIKLTNDGADEVKNWTLQFKYPAEIQGMWGAKVSKRQGADYVIVPEDWSRMIRPGGGQVTLGFQAAPGGLTPEAIVFEPVIAGDQPAAPPVATNPPDPSGITQRPIYGGRTDVRAISATAEVDFRVIADWGSGFQAEIVIRNTGDTPLRNWNLGFDMPRRITGMWNAHIVSISGDRLVIDAATEPWNRDIPPGGEVRFGFLGAPGAVVGRPQNITINEAPADTQSTSTDTESALMTTPQAPTPPMPVPPRPVIDYSEALRMALWFYDAQRSGPLPPDNRVEWRGNSAMQDGADVGVDLTGGYFDAGDGMKFALPMASAMTLLAWGGIEFREGYDRAAEWPMLLRTVRWGADWLMKAHPEPNVFYGQVGRGDLDHAFWGPPESMTMERPAFRIDADHPGSELAGEAAAALAAASILFQSQDPEYAALCLRHARELFAFADQHRGIYTESITDARAYYHSFTGYHDELAWAGAWLYRATNDKTYLEKAEKTYADELSNGQWNWTHSWDDKKYGTAVLLASLTEKKHYRQDVTRWLGFWTVGYDGQRVQTTKGGLAWLDQWGSLRYAANTAFLALVASRIPGMPDATRDRTFAKRQIDYILGDNPVRRSYVVGYGSNPPLNPHHRASHGSTSGNINDPVNNRHTLFGALVGGPSAPNDFSYVDDRSNYITNEVALDYNAGFSGALAGLLEENN